MVGTDLGLSRLTKLQRMTPSESSVDVSSSPAGSRMVKTLSSEDRISRSLHHRSRPLLVGEDVGEGEGEEEGGVLLPIVAVGNAADAATDDVVVVAE